MSSGPTTTRPFASALAGFVVLCGLLLLWLGTGDDARRPNPVTSGDQIEFLDDRLQNALDAAQRAREAIDSNNYGDVRRHLDSLEHSLTEALAQTGARDL